LADLLTPERVLPLLRGRFGIPYLHVESCTSTQRLLADDAPEGAVVVAEAQTAGRGRLGRSWIAPPRTSLLFSLRLQPPLPTERLPELSLVAGRAVARALADETGLAPTLKHPNDVLIGGRKLCGILAEASEGRVTLGIGVNVNQTEAELPRETVTPPTSLRLETERELDRAPLLAALLERLEREYDAWLNGAAS
jgi:BirA family transcriptional regulator, biotin operon repressor / biotin---[acetyl-CoA-carboxylase] ligase